MSRKRYEWTVLATCVAGLFLTMGGCPPLSEEDYAPTTSGRPANSTGVATTGASPRTPTYATQGHCDCAAMQRRLDALDAQIAANDRMGDIYANSGDLMSDMNPYSIMGPASYGAAAGLYGQNALLIDEAISLLNRMYDCGCDLR